METEQLTIEEWTKKKDDILEIKEHIKRINDIRNSSNFKNTERIRHDIVHNNPPLSLENPVKHRKDGISTLGTGKYINSESIKYYMDIFFEQYSEMLSIIKEMLESENCLKDIVFENIE